MQPIYITDPVWSTTFPHLVAPLDDEWLAGLLLRCDVVNGWDSGATVSYLLRATHPRTDLQELSLVLPLSPAFLQLLAVRLAVPVNALLATTYWAELARLYETPNPHIQLLGIGFGFHFCPECLAEARMLRRTFLLPHITCCPFHHLKLLSTCACHEGKPPPKTDLPIPDSLLKFFHDLGVLQRLFSPGKKPFTCRGCGLNWANFPRLKVDPERLTLEQKILAWYDFFFSKGTLDVLSRALQAIDRTLQQRQKKSVKRLNRRTIPVTFTSPEKTTLGHLVDVLVSLDLSPNVLEIEENRFFDSR
jgi:TniQ